MGNTRKLATYISFFWFGGIIVWHYKEGYKPLNITSGLKRINGKTIGALEDVLVKCSEGGRAFLTLNSEAVERVNGEYRRKEDWYERMFRKE